MNFTCGSLSIFAFYSLTLNFVISDVNINFCILVIEPLLWCQHFHFILLKFMKLMFELYSLKCVMTIVTFYQVTFMISMFAFYLMKFMHSREIIHYIFAWVIITVWYHNYAVVYYIILSTIQYSRNISITLCNTSHLLRTKWTNKNHNRLILWPYFQVAWYRLFARSASSSNVKVRLNDYQLPGTGDEVLSRV